MRLTEAVHHTLREHLHPGDTAIDATTGNGHDTAFLADCVGSHGQVYGFDIQEAALKQAAQALQEQGLARQVSLIHAGHETMAEAVPPTACGHVRAILFNLGYLPGHDHALTTQIHTTLQALDASLRLLAEGGLLSVLAYTGHAGGREECEAAKTWAATLEPKHYQLSIEIPQAIKHSPPEWILIRKLRR